MKAKGHFPLKPRRKTALTMLLLFCLAGGFGYGQTSPGPGGIGQQPIEIPEGAEVFYDDSGRIAYLVTKEGKKIDYSYDSQDRVIALVDPEKTVQFEYNASDQRVKMTETPKDASDPTLVVQYEYDESDRLKKFQQQDPEISAQGYDGLIVRYTYDTSGSPTENITLVKGEDEISPSDATGDNQ